MAFVTSSGNDESTMASAFFPFVPPGLSAAKCMAIVIPESIVQTSLFIVFYAEIAKLFIGISHLGSFYKRVGPIVAIFPNRRSLLQVHNKFFMAVFQSIMARSAPFGPLKGTFSLGCSDTSNAIVGISL
jgi:hypothetical protein